MQDHVFYHLFPLGACGAPRENDLVSPPVDRLSRVEGWLDHIEGLGANALLLGPVFESRTHGYDTVEFARVDRRLGTDDSLRRLAEALHRRGMRLALDAVFNHVGRDCFAFRDLRERGEASPYRDWFRDLRFGRRSPLGDPFSYGRWGGVWELPRLNLRNPEVRAWLLDGARRCLVDFGVDGFRLDVAEELDPDFVREVAATCRTVRPEVWLMGEMIHGDGRRLAGPDMLDAFTNYELYKGLWSSHVDHNYHEVAASLDRQFGPHGLYRDLKPYNFADNHDVSRVASSLRSPAHLYPLYLLLFMVPGTPSIYQGSEWGLAGVKGGGDDWHLRPPLDLVARGPHPDLAPALTRFARVRRELPALQEGRYERVAVDALGIAFERVLGEARVLVIVNASEEARRFSLPATGRPRRMRDLLNDEELVLGARRAEPLVPPCWGRVLVPART